MDKMNKASKTSFLIGLMKGMQMAKELRLLFIALLLVGAAFAQQEGLPIGARFYNILNYLCGNMVMLMPVVAIALLVGAALVYGMGHVFGSEWKQKAQSWATNMIIGMFISLLLYLLAKPLVQMMYPEVSTEGFCVPPEFG